MLRVQALFLLSVIFACLAPQRKVLPPGFKEVRLENLRWIVRGEKSQEERRSGFAMQLFVDHATQNVYQLGIVGLTDEERALALREPEALIERAFLLYFNSLKGARRKGESAVKHHWSGREYVWQRERGGILLEGRTRIYLTRDGNQAIHHSVLYDSAGRDLSAIRAFFMALEEVRQDPAGFSSDCVPISNPPDAHGSLAQVFPARYE